jgi:hypothetical protein
VTTATPGSYATSMELINKGINRIEEAVKNLK